MGFQTAITSRSATARAACARFRGRPWRRIDLSQLADVLRVPTMLAGEEQQFYLWLTRDWMEGDGAVVDLGACVGGSTARLAEGHRIAGRGGRIYAYDRFRADDRLKARLLYPGGVAPFEGQDAFRVARRLLAPWRDRTILMRGEIQDVGWRGGPIAVLAIDAFKQVALIDRMVADFFPALVPGRSIVVQQDFLHWSQPWLCALMDRFGDAFQRLCHVPNDTVAYLLRRPMTASRIEAARIGGIGDDELFAAIARTRRVMTGWNLSHRFDAMEAGLRANPGARVAWKMRRPSGPP
ncbi:hypothetical protein [Oceaniglobus trochenteri]|uniref:hypothetical protein n=1 Tax=Oceaniglobus trochenteri TaxID=2763260 RepID=UPI001CFFA2A2|nr:hypothetical protein [Oceaniglobus trochenteri]